MFHHVRADICFPDDAGALYLVEAPDRWDEYLDLSLPIFISWRCGRWSELLKALELAGFSERYTARLVEAGGRVSPLVRKGRGQWSPAPTEALWTLVLNWSHPEEGWRWKLPLAGRRYVITREASKAREMVAQLEAQGAVAVPLPTISFEQPDRPNILQKALRELESFDWIVFTSPNGVRFFFEALQNSDKDHRTIADTKFACIGPSTAKALKKAGFGCDLLPDRYVAEGLLEAFESSVGSTMTHLKVLIPRAQEAREILPNTLRVRGAEVLVAPAYKTVQPALPEEFVLTNSHRVLFTSSSTVKHWMELVGNPELACFCIGPITAQTAREFGIPILGVAIEHTVEGLLAEVERVDGREYYPYRLDSVETYYTDRDPQMGTTLVPSGLSATGRISMKSGTSSWVVERDQAEGREVTKDGLSLKVLGISPNGEWVCGVTKSLHRPPCKNGVETAFVYNLESDVLQFFESDEPYFRQAYAVNDLGKVAGFGAERFSREQCQHAGESIGLFACDGQLERLPKGRPQALTSDNLVVSRVRNVAALVEPGSDTPFILKLPEGYAQSVAYAIDSGQRYVAGSILCSEQGTWHPALWSLPKGICRPLLLDNNERPLGLALGVNAEGLAVGIYFRERPTDWNIYSALHTSWPVDGNKPKGDYQGEAFYCAPGESTIVDMSGWFGPTLHCAAHLDDDGYFVGHFQHHRPEEEGGNTIRPFSARLVRR